MSVERVKIIIAGGIIVLVMIVLAFFIGKSRQKSSDEVELQKSKQNYSALSETLEVYRNKNNALTFEKSSLSVSIDELNKINCDLSSEIKASRGKVLSMTQEIIQYEKNYSGLLDKYQSDVKIVKVPDVVGNDTSEFKLDWHLKSNSVELKEVRWDVQGVMDVMVSANPSGISLNRADLHLNKIKIDLTVFSSLQYDEKKKLFRAAVSCQDSNVHIRVSNWVDPNTFFPKENKFSFGINAGYGYCLGDTKSNFGIFVGVGVSYKLFSLF